MSFSEQLAYCLSLVEKKAKFGPSEEWTSKDYENLSLLIERETRISISVSTLRRLWDARYEGSPQKATMDALAKFAGYSDWLSYVQEAYPPNQKSVNSSRSKMPYLYGLLIVAVIAIAAGIYLKRPPSGNDRNNEIHVFNDHQSGMETAVITNAGDAAVLGQPMKQTEILSGEIGWNAVVHSGAGPLVLETEDFFSENGIDITSYLDKSKRRRLDYSGFHFYYIKDFKGFHIGNLQLSGILEIELPGMGAEKGIIEIKLATSEDVVTVQLDPVNAKTHTQIGDNMAHNTLKHSVFSKQSVLSFQMQSDQNTFTFHLNNTPVILLDSVSAKGDLFAISFFSESPITLRSTSLQSATDSSLVFELL